MDDLTLKDCVLVSSLTAAESIYAGAPANMRLYGSTMTNKAKHADAMFLTGESRFEVDGKVESEGKKSHSTQRDGGRTVLHDMSLLSPQSNDPENALAKAAAHGIRATIWGIVASTILAAVKVIAGITGNSYALIADGVESMLDIMSSLVVWGSLRVAAQPATERYPYGYGKAEPLAALAVATALLGAAVGIAIQSIREIRTPHHLPEPFTLIVLIAVVLAKETMFRLLIRTGKDIGSKAMQTDAWHHRSDSLTSIAAFIGISVALFAGEGYESADDWAALFAAAVIAFNGVRLFRMALREILDVSPAPELVAKIKGIAGRVPNVIDIEKCRVRSSGLIYFVDLHLIVDANLTVAEGHKISHQVKDALLASDLGIRDVTVHIEPGDPSR